MCENGGFSLSGSHMLYTLANITQYDIVIRGMYEGKPVSIIAVQQVQVLCSEYQRNCNSPINRLEHFIKTSTL